MARTLLQGSVRKFFRESGPFQAGLEERFRKKLEAKEAVTREEMEKAGLSPTRINRLLLLREGPPDLLRRPPERPPEEGLPGVDIEGIAGEVPEFDAEAGPSPSAPSSEKGQEKSKSPSDDFDAATEASQESADFGGGEEGDEDSPARQTGEPSRVDPNETITMGPGAGFLRTDRARLLNQALRRRPAERRAQAKANQQGQTNRQINDMREAAKAEMVEAREARNPEDVAAAHQKMEEVEDFKDAALGKERVNKAVPTETAGGITRVEIAPEHGGGAGFARQGPEPSQQARFADLGSGEGELGGIARAIVEDAAPHGIIDRDKINKAEKEATGVSNVIASPGGEMDTSMDRREKALQAEFDRNKFEEEEKKKRRRQAALRNAKATKPA